MALKGVKVLEILGLAPGPLCGTILADFGASVTVIHKIEQFPFDVMSNGKRMVGIDLKNEEGANVVKKLCCSADVLLDTSRPGVMEKLGLGPTVLIQENPKLIYARLSGYGQSGPFKNKAGHDINYVAMSGLLSMLVTNNQPPRPPLNLLADFAGGSLTCVLGILLALFERTKSGKGQIVDVSMTNGAAYLGTWLFKSRKLPIWRGPPGTNFLDGGFPFYCTYKTKDGKYMAVGALEYQFYSNLLKGLNLTEQEYPQMGEEKKCNAKFTEIFLSKSQDEWCEIFKGLDACVTPVLDIDTVDTHECHKGQKTFYKNEEDLIIPTPAPLLSRSPGKSTGYQPVQKPGQDTVLVLQELGYTYKEIDELKSKGCIFVNDKSHL